MRTFVTFFFLLFCLGAAAQQQGSTEWQREVDREVWEPLNKGVVTDDENLYLPIHSKDYVRIQARTGSFLNFEEYVDDTRKVMQNFRNSGTRVKLEQRFTERFSNGRFASDRGITRVSITDASGKVTYSFARFHVICRKEAGGWKMLTEFVEPLNAGEDGPALFAQAGAAQ